jgi:glycosyltransferase involved in cell wall biosynthesis
VVAGELAVRGGEQLRVGFVLLEGHWLGGQNYFRNLFRVLRSLSGEPIVPVIFAGERQKDAGANFPGVEVVRSSMLDRKSAGWVIRQAIFRLTGRDRMLEGLLRRHGVSVLSHSLHLGRGARVKTIGWIADLQHLHLPELFTKEERRVRSQKFGEMCAYCDRILVSSEWGREDVARFAPAHGHKTDVLRFVTATSLQGSGIGLAELEQTYGFAGPYFLLPNQFWAHKNHRDVITALGLLKKRRQPQLVLATGSHSGTDGEAVFASLMAYAAECNVLDCFRALGVIPYEDLVGLMEGAVGFINPSRFEGWSTSVEEAKSMGKQIILSDIPVHREQAPARSFYFPLDDPEALAEALLAASRSFEPDYDRDMQELAKSRYPNRLREFGEAYCRIVAEVLRSDRA